ncbi:MAG: phenylalanine--tRNA ligase subunit beta [Bacteroidota bacterium]
MRVLDDWLREFVHHSVPPEELAERLSMLGLEIEGIEHAGERYARCVVGLVETREAHPAADRLSICRVHVGGDVLPIVCGAPNVEAGQKVAVALPGAVLPGAGRVEPVSVRGVDSSGMICSEQELGLGEGGEGILVLDPGTRVGAALAPSLGLDRTVYEVETTANRPDWLSHIGVAREIRVLTGSRLRVPATAPRESGGSVEGDVSVRVEDPEGCPRFAVRLVRGVRIGPSPLWMRARLAAAGLRPRNNVVDVTNYVMLELGHPLHAFDFDLLAGARLAVRKSGPNDRLKTLDGQDREIPAGSVVICDAAGPVSLAGIMGGAGSEIRETTVNVLLESALWNPSCIRRTARALGLSTDASQRFERGADPGAVRRALDRAARLVLATAGGRVLKGVVDVASRKDTPRVIPLRPERVEGLLGTRITSARITRSLSLLDIHSAGRRGRKLMFRVPSFRVDIEREVDLIEEVARVHGYDNIEVRTSARVDMDHRFPRVEPVMEIRRFLAGRGLQEVLSMSLQPATKARLGSGSPAGVMNARMGEMSFLRSALLPGILDAVALNRNAGNADLRLFEIGRVFREADRESSGPVDGYREEERVSIALAGKSGRTRWDAASRQADLYDLKGIVQDLMEFCRLDKCRLICYSTADTLAADPIAVEINGSYAGYLGKVRGDILKLFGLEGDVFAAELFLAPLVEGGRTAGFKPLARYPRVRRDIALLVDGTVTAEAAEQAIRAGASELLHSVELFDVYEGKGIPQGKKSMAFSLELLSEERTLTDGEIEQEMGRIVRSLERAVGAALRAS